MTSDNNRKDGAGMDTGDVRSALGEWGSILPTPAIIAAETALERAQKRVADGETVFPPREDVFRALTLTPPDRVRVVVLGQDPYHGEGEACGLAFSVNPGCKIPPSLRNIFKELNADLGLPIPQSGDLTPWAEQGVLLLNTVLTVEKDRANSHKDFGWQAFTRDVIATVNGFRQPVVFLLWGMQAVKDGMLLTSGPSKRHLLSTHPSPLAASRKTGSLAPFLGSRPFSAANRELKDMGAEPINWALP